MTMESPGHEDEETGSPIDAGVSESTPTKTRGQQNLSAVSSRYDKGNKGYLDEVEQEMRNRDKNNYGHLDDREVRRLAQDLLRTQEQSKKRRNWAIVLASLVVVLAVANIGTTYLAISLSKDTTVKADGTLVTTDGDIVVATRGVGITVLFNSTIDEATGESYSCIPIETVAEMWTDLSRGTSVSLLLSSLDGQEEQSSSMVGLSTDGAQNDSGRVCFETTGSGTRLVCVTLGGGGRCGGSSNEEGRRLFHSHVDRLSDSQSSPRSRLLTVTGGCNGAKCGELVVKDCFGECCQTGNCYHFLARASGAQEVPAVESRTSGWVQLYFDNRFTNIWYTLDVFKGRKITQAHLHCGPAGANGPVVAFLFNVAPVGGPGGVTRNGRISKGKIIELSSTDGTGVCDVVIDSPSSLFEAIQQRKIYVNVHSEENHAGEIRGQIFPL